VENDLVVIKQRQDLLEAQMNALEARIDWQEGMLKLVDAGIGATAGPSGAKPQAGQGVGDSGQRRPGVQDIESLLHSIVLKQSLHSTTLRSLEQTQQSGQSSLQRGIDTAVSRLDLILESLRRAQVGRHDR
jgi:hypothetical protein